MHCFVRTAKLIGRAGGILFALIFWYFCIKTKVRKKKKEISINSFRNFWLQAFIKVGHCFLGNYFPQTAINGNISCLSTDYYTETPLLKSFRYDKLNRIKRMQTASISAGEWGSLTDNFSTEYRYDYNGNILSLQRRNANAVLMHRINYTYNTKNNRLQAITATGINSSSYDYDAIGNLIEDSGEDINITWNAANKVKTVTTSNNNLSFSYSPTGQRQIKETGDKTEYYLHDATGNIMCIYELSGNYLTVKERTIYGSKRIGVYRQRIRFGYSGIVGGVVIAPGSDLVNVLHPQPVISPDGRHYLEGSNRLQVIGVNRAIAQTSTISYTYKKGTPELKGLSPLMAVRPTFLDGTKTVGLRDYELTDHLSNVMAVISDRKLSVDTNNDTITDYYEPQVVSYTDYYPFGFPIAERSGNLSGYRFGFNGQEADNEVYGSKQSYTAEFWQYDTRLGRRWNVDPKRNAGISSFACYANNPIYFNDIHGDTVRNGYQDIIDKAKNLIKNLEKNNEYFKSKYGLTEESKKEDFVSDEVSLTIWNAYQDNLSSLKRERENLGTYQWMFNMTKSIIREWAKQYPLIFEAVNKASIDFILFAKSPDYMKIRFNTVGANVLKNYENMFYSEEWGRANAIDIYISYDQKGYFVINHEAGHFLYFSKFTAQYIQYLNLLNMYERSQRTGHEWYDESGKVARKYEDLKGDEKLPEILEKGN